MVHFDFSHHSAVSAILLGLCASFFPVRRTAACKSLGLTEVFVGSRDLFHSWQCKESTALLFALKNKMDLSLGMLSGDSGNALFITPLLFFPS